MRRHFLKLHQIVQPRVIPQVIAVVYIKKYRVESKASIGSREPIRSKFRYDVASVSIDCFTDHFGRSPQQRWVVNGAVATLDNIVKVIVQSGQHLSRLIPASV